MVVASSWLKPSRSMKLTSSVFLSGLISSSASRTYFTSPSPVWNLHDGTDGRETIYYIRIYRILYEIFTNQKHNNLRPCRSRVASTQNNAISVLLKTYSSKKAWNNFWHFSANSSFTISLLFSAVAVATSMLKFWQNPMKRGGND